ncbi:MAG: D-threo-aldose 1-dehydrogenase [Rhodospirillaceae bacterium]|nr:D-threo-aldose 1-dehydrogenase [Rhodospirillaceae bacterium]
MTLSIRPLGNSGITLTALGLGGTALGNLYNPTSEVAAFATIRAAFDDGIRFFDTAPLYGHGLSEHRLGGAFRTAHDMSFVLSTKVGWRLFPARGADPAAGHFKEVPPFRRELDYSYDGVLRSFEDSLHRLGRDRVDIVLIHDCDRRNQGDDYPARFKESMDGAYRALLHLRDEGAVRAIGCGLNEWQACEDFARAGDFNCFLLAGRYTLLDQDSLDSFMPLCAERGIGIILGGPYNSGILASGAVEGAYYDYAPATPKILDRVRRIQAVCRRHDVPLQTAALQFPLFHPVVTTLIPGMRNPAEVVQNVAFLNHETPVAFWHELRHEKLIREDAPLP